MSKRRPDSREDKQRLSTQSNRSQVPTPNRRDLQQLNLNEWAAGLPTTAEQRAQAQATAPNSNYPGTPTPKLDDPRQPGSARNEVIDVEAAHQPAEDASAQVPAGIHMAFVAPADTFNGNCQRDEFPGVNVKLELSAGQNTASPPKSDGLNESSHPTVRSARPRPGEKPAQWFVDFFEKVAEIVEPQLQKQ